MKKSLSSTRAYKVWSSVCQRFFNEKNLSHKKYKYLPFYEPWKDFREFYKDMGEIPDDKNSLGFFNTNIGFVPDNVYWKSGKRRNPKERGGTKIFSDPFSICLTLEKSHADFIRKQAIQASMSKGYFVSMNSLIREVLIKAFPVPHEFDMFGDRK